jgi:hypothetical protein
MQSIIGQNPSPEYLTSRAYLIIHYTYYNNDKLHEPWNGYVNTRKSDHCILDTP